jgi:hypothetical protein
MPTPSKQRQSAALFLFVAIQFGLGILVCKYTDHFWKTAGAFTLTVFAAVNVILWWFLLGIWERHVPAKVSWALGTVAWLLLFFLALTDHLIPHQ